MLALASPQAWQTVQSDTQLAMILLGACSRLARQNGSWVYYAHDEERRHRLMADVWKWLLMELPAPLANTDAESALNRFAEHETA